MFIVAYSIDPHGQIKILVEGSTFYGDLMAVKLPYTCLPFIHSPDDTWNVKEDRPFTQKEMKKQEEDNLKQIMDNLVVDDNVTEQKVDEMMYIKIKWHCFRTVLDDDHCTALVYPMLTLAELKNPALGGLSLVDYPIENIFQQIMRFEIGAHI